MRIASWNAAMRNRRWSTSQRGTSAGTAWLEKNEIRLNPVLLLENQREFIDEVVRMSWRTCWSGSISAASRRTERVEMDDGERPWRSRASHPPL
ncbi:protein sprT [Klebsiella pneumoniae]|uniref:Protein sprT n=1 Tax=Klebsiella pneumoniae TaxID=573 RepID=A0A2X3EWM9_KLEPN|nr:protein sprT [Klebsiella pneumoniae]